VLRDLGLRNVGTPRISIGPAGYRINCEDRGTFSECYLGTAVFKTFDDTARYVLLLERRVCTLTHEPRRAAGVCVHPTFSTCSS